MEFEDNTKALFVEPNAYVQNIKRNECQKIVFSEPYESVPNYYINNGFEKHDCKSVHNTSNKNNKCNNSNKHNGNKGFNFLNNFNLKSLAPMFSMFFKDGGFSLANIVNLLGSNGGNFSGVQSILQNKNLISTLTNMLNGGSNEKSSKNNLTETDFEIKNYVRVE